MVCLLRRGLRTLHRLRLSGCLRDARLLSYFLRVDGITLSLRLDLRIASQGQDSPRKEELLNNVLHHVIV